jgi:hypothetical protein
VKILSFVSASLAVVLLCSSAFPQGSTGRVLGSISDPSGAVIPGVTVTVRDVERGTARTLTTDEAGLYNPRIYFPEHTRFARNFPDSRRSSGRTSNWKSARTFVSM